LSISIAFAPVGEAKQPTKWRRLAAFLPPSWLLTSSDHSFENLDISKFRKVFGGYSA